ncbi:MAG: hypothetical protein AAFU79_22480 [Myxococcota bacterium]
MPAFNPHSSLATACLLGMASLGVTSATAAPKPSAAQATEEDETLFWHSNLENAVAEARKTGRPIFLEYRCAP